MSFEMVHSRTEYPGDPILRSELAYQIRIGRHQPSVLNAIRDLGKAAKAAEQARDTHEWAVRAFREAAT